MGSGQSFTRKSMHIVELCPMNVSGLIACKGSLLVAAGQHHSRHSITVSHISWRFEDDSIRKLARGPTSASAAAVLGNCNSWTWLEAASFRRPVWLRHQPPPIPTCRSSRYPGPSYQGSCTEYRFLVPAPAYKIVRETKRSFAQSLTH